MKNIQEKLWDFIYSWRDELTKSLKDKIDFIIIYGSAVRGEFVPGKSDVDMVIQVFKNGDKKEVEKAATDIFWKTAKNFPELKFRESLSISSEKKASGITYILKTLEKSSFLYVPVFVFAEGEIDWKNGELNSNNPLISAGKALLIPQRSVFLRFQQEGMILFGRDIRKEIAIKLTLIDRLRLGAAPQFLSFMALLISPIAVKKSLSYSVKALLYQIDGLLTALDHYEKLARAEKISKSEKILLEDFTEQLQNVLHLKLDHTKGLLRPGDFGLFYEAMLLKQGMKRLSHLQTIRFSVLAWWFIVRSNLRVLIYLLFFRKKKSSRD